jgi:amidase
MSPEADVSQKSVAGFRPKETGIAAYELWQIQKARRDLRQEYLAHWAKTAEVTETGRPVDAIIAPCAAYAAPPHGLNGHVSCNLE